MRAYAKVNLGLAVIGRRDDGFHELRTIYQSISLADRIDITVEPGKRSVRLECTGIEVPEGRKNLAFRAAEAVMKECGLAGQVLIRLRKQIPAGSGLGGASSDAAAVMCALLYISGKQFEQPVVQQVAATLGSDVPFFLYGGRALGVGRGEEVYPLPDLPRQWCVVVFPGIPVSTRDAYRRLRAPLLTSRRAAHNIELFCSRMNASEWTCLGNDFERLVLRDIPQLGEVKDVLLTCGASLASLSGSGSAVFGMFEHRSNAANAVQRLTKPGYDVFLTRTVSRREFQAPFAKVRSLP